MMFSNMAQHWLEARDTIESYANEFFFARQPSEKPVATSEWLQDSMSFGTRMWSLWLKGIAMMAEEGGRLARRAADEKAKADKAGSTGS